MPKYDVGYMQRTREYYRAQGYTVDYQWAHFDEVPFTRPGKPLAESRVAVVTTAMPNDARSRAQRQLRTSPSEPVPASMYTDNLFWDSQATHTRDVGSFLPLAQLRQLRNAGVIGDSARRFHCVPTEYSQRNTMEKHAPEVLRHCREDGVDLALLVPL